MSAVRAVANADSWSLSTGLKGYFSCCFSKTEPTPENSSDLKDAPDAPPEPVPDLLQRRWSAEMTKNDEDGDATMAECEMVVDLRLEADGASVHSTGTDKANIGADNGHLLTSRDAGASTQIIIY